jgi:anaerobic selenocysteine-containing dehydrogenase
MAHVLIEEGMIDRQFLIEQTDMPLLVRDDTHHYLRASDMVAGGSEEEFYFHRESGSGQSFVLSNKRSLALDGQPVSLEGRFEVLLADGEMVSVRTVFSLLKERLVDYTPEKASAICNTPPGLIRDLARRLGRAKAASMVTTSNFSKYYHGNLIERTQALVFALTGNYGKKGSGFVAFPFLATDGMEHFVREMFTLKDMMSPEAVKVVGKMALDRARWKLDGYTDEMIAYEQGHDLVADGMMASGSLFWYVHGGLLEASENHPEWDPYLKRPIREILDESLAKGWQHVWPKPGNHPRVMFVYGSNPLRRVRSYPLIEKNLWPKLRTIVTLDMRMTSTAMKSDFVLPASAWYERDEHKWGTPLMPYIHSGEKAASYYESKSDWWIVSSLAIAVDRRAKARGMTSFVDRKGNTRPLDNLFEKYSNGGKYGPDDDAVVCAELLEHSTNCGGITWDELKKKGFHRLTGIGTSPGCVGNATEFGPDETITPLTDHVFEKVPYPTMTRRMQFYLDQALYLEMGEELPLHKDPPTAGGDYPLILTGGHTRWSIHSAWRDDKLMLQQQRGEPVVFIGLEDAASRGVKDGAQVRVHNDLDSFQVMAKVSPALRPGQLIIYHAWENYQFKDGKGFQNLMPTPLNPVDLAGGYFHLRPGVITRQPNHTDRDTRVEVVAL